jgi:hypothetical protein
MIRAWPSDAALVGAGEAGGDLRGEVDRDLDLERSAGDLVRHGLAFEEGQGDEEPAVGSLAHLVDRADVGVLQGGGGLGLAGQAEAVLLAGGDAGRQELEGDQALEIEVARLVHRSPSRARGEALQEQVV